MRRSLPEIIDQRVVAPITKWVGTIIYVDYYSKIIAVNIKGASGPRRVKVNNTIDLGTSDNPLVFAGAQVIIERLDDEYYATAFIANPTKQVLLNG